MDDNKNISYTKESLQQIQEALVASGLAGVTLGESLEKAKKSAKSLASSVSKVKRILAGFDEINRLGQKKTSGSSKKKTTTKKTETEKKEETQAPAKQEPPKQEPQELATLPQQELPELQMFENGALNLAWVGEQLGNLKDSVVDFWDNTLVPMSGWFDEGLLPGIRRIISEGLNPSQDKVIGFNGSVGGLWQQLTGGTGQLLQTVLPGLQQLDTTFGTLTGVFSLGSQQIGSSTNAMGQQVSGTAGFLQQCLQGLGIGWNSTLGQLQTGTATMSTGVTGSLRGITDFLLGGFSTAWSNGFAGLGNPAKGAFNSIIGLMNKMTGGFGGALNGVIGAANKLKISVPDWVPGIGGKQYGLSLKSVSIPQVPYLAKGAVLPANRPFLAMVGDQRSGTNVEAPLTTIQEAVANVMADHTAGNMAGHEATVQMLERILEAVLGIDVGEAVIGRAVQNYRLKNAVMKGGGF